MLKPFARSVYDEAISVFNFDSFLNANVQMLNVDSLRKFESLSNPDNPVIPKIMLNGLVWIHLSLYHDLLDLRINRIQQKQSFYDHPDSGIRYGMT